LSTTTTESCPNIQCSPTKNVLGLSLEVQNSG
jgi:hypothetical protein